MKRIKLFLAAIAAMVTMGVQAQTWTGNAVGAGTFYLYNVGAGKFLNVGDPSENWGTNAWLSTNSNFDVTLASVGENLYTIETGIKNNDTDHYLSNSTWCDGGAINWTFRAVDNETNVYQIIYNGEYLMADAALNDVQMLGDPAGRTTSTYWKLVTKEDRIAALAYATPSNPMDATFLIVDANFGRNDTRVSAWSITANNKNLSGGNNKNNCAESYHSDFSLSQTLSGIPNGTYKMTAQGFYRKDGAANDKLPYFFLGESVENFPVKNGSENSMSDASVSFTNGSYTINPITAVVSNGTINVGAKLEGQNNGGNNNANGLWCIWDNFQLTYYGNSVGLTNATFDTNGDNWTGIAPAVSYAVAEFYNKTYDMYQNLSGLTPGIYAVEVQGFYRNAGTTNGEFRVKNQENLCAFLYATGNGSTYQTALTSIFDEAGNGGSAYGTLVGDVPNSMQQAATFFSKELYTDNKVLVEVGTDGALTIGLKKETAKGSDWTLFDNFSVTKLAYSTLTDAYAAEWTARKAAATTLLNSSDYTNILDGDAARSALNSAVGVTPSDLEGYYSALTTLRTAVNGFKASKYAYDQFASVVAPVIAAENTTYAHITGQEKTTFDTNVTNALASLEKNAANYYGLIAQVNSFTSAKASYDEYYYENETATRLGADASGVSAPTTAAEAETAAHAINVINYNKFVEEEYADVSNTVLGGWTDNNVVSRNNQHWSGDASREYFEMNTGYLEGGNWTMSRQQTVSLAAGSYVLKVAARVSAGADAELSVTVGSNTPIVTYVGHHGDNGKGITTDGTASYDDGTFANSTGRGFEWRYIPFTLDSDGSVTLKFYAVNTSGNKNQYVSFCDLGIWTDPKIAARTELLTAISNATAARKEANEGTGIFQIPVSEGTTLASAITAAQNVYDNDEATLQDITSATTGMNTVVTGYENAVVNAPSSTTRYKLNLANRGALTFRNAETEGGYGMPFMTAADYKAQTFFLTQVSGNTYNLSFVDFDGNTRYVCTRADYGEGGTGTAGIRTTDDSSKALGILIQPTATANVFNMLNTARDNEKLGADNDGDFYTVATNSDWSIAEASQASVTVSCKAGKFGTVIFPFTPDVSTGFGGITFYSIDGINNTTNRVQIEEVTTPAANVPYLIKNDNGSDFSEALTGWGTAAQESYTDGLLTGVFTAATIPASTETTNYVLQTPTSGENEGVQAFYKVDAAFTATANKCYLSVTGSNVKALYFDFNGTDAVNSIEADNVQNTPIFNLAGQRVEKAQKGIYIVNGKKVLVK